MISKFFLVFFIIFVFALSGSIYANEELNLPSTKINPGSFYYSYKRLWEKGIEKLQFSRQSKINFYQSQLKTKLAELNFVVENKLLSEVQRSSERFAFQAGILTDLLIKQRDEQKDGQTARKTIEDFQKYNRFLEGLRDKYEANSSFWMLIQHDINSLSILSERLK